MTIMAFMFRPLRWDDALAVARWHYPAPYELYDLGRIPLLVGVSLHWLLAPLSRLGFFAVRSGDDPLVGVFSFHRQGQTVELGLALRPDLTGRRIGLEFVEAGMEFARRTFAPATFRLDVATFNQRAIRVYERAGFVPGPRFIRYTRLGPYEFMEMTRVS
jgi:ribosomal-protein-alanine N-acetyltransferase